MSNDDQKIDAGASAIGDIKPIGPQGSPSPKEDRLSPAEQKRVSAALSEAKRQEEAARKNVTHPKRTPTSGRMYEVTDTSCTSSNRKRAHDIIMDGEIISIDFAFGTPTILPFAKAMKFQKEGFIVRDEDGQIINRPTESTVESIAQFGPDKVVAYAHELTVDALYARVAALPGGEDYTINSHKAVLVEFLVNTAKKKIRDNTHQDGHEMAEMDASDLENMGLTMDEAA